MKKAKPRSRSATQRKAPPTAAKSGAKSKRRSAVASGPRSATAVASAGFEELNEAIGALAAIAAELRQIADDLRDTIRSGQESDIDAVVVTEVEGLEAGEGRGQGQEDLPDDFEEDS
jgi:hypothetical protein